MEAYRIKHKPTRLYYDKFGCRRVKGKSKSSDLRRKGTVYHYKKTISFLQGRLCKSNNERAIVLS